MGVAIFDEMRLPDVPGLPKLRDASGDWFRDIVRAAFGSWDPDAGVRHIRDIFAMAPKGSSKTSYSAGLMLSVMLMNRRPRAEALFVGPTQAISDRAYEQAVGMIDADPDLRRRFRPRDHIKTIEDLFNHSEMKVRTFDVSILTGSILIFVLLDELHLLGRNQHTTKVLRQIRGGLEKTQEGLLLITTTQSDEQPVGAFKEELNAARNIRDGKYRGRVMRPLLPILYEFPPEIAKDQAKWADPANWPMVMPNLGRSVHLQSLVADWESEKEKGKHAIQVWASQHLNIEIGQGIRNDEWVAASIWPDRADDGLGLDELLTRSEVVVIGIDGGGMDDLLSLAVLGRDAADSRHWMVWGKSWAHRKVLERRKNEASRLEGFAEDGDLTIVERLGDDLDELVSICQRVDETGLLAGVGVDRAGVGGIVDAIAAVGIGNTDDADSTGSARVFAIPQGWQMSGPIKTAERKLADGTMTHGGQPILAWAVGNAKTELHGNALMVTKAAAGSAKIDPLVAVFDAIAMMSKNPMPPGGGVPQIFSL